MAAIVRETFVRLVWVAAFVDRGASYLFFLLFFLFIHVFSAAREPNFSQIANERTIVNYARISFTEATREAFSHKTFKLRTHDDTSFTEVQRQAAHRPCRCFARPIVHSGQARSQLVGHVGV